MTSSSPPRIRTGVVGVGHLGYHHARIYNALPDAELVGVVDSNDERRYRAANDFTTAGFSDIRALVEAGVEAVSVATPTSTHAEIAAELLQHGIHVLVEKPLTRTVAEAELLITLAHTHHRVLQVGHSERFNGAVLALFEVVKRPRFIECHRMSPYPKRSTDVSVVHDLMIHDLDILLQLDRSDIVSLDAVGVPVFSEEEDIANVRLRFASGCVANVTSSRISVEPLRKIRVFEDNAYTTADYAQQEVLRYWIEPEVTAEGTDPMSQVRVEALPVQKEEPLRLELQSFLTAIRTGSRPVVSGEDGLRALRLVQRVLEQIRAKT